MSKGIAYTITTAVWALLYIIGNSIIGATGITLFIYGALMFTALIIALVKVNRIITKRNEIEKELERINADTKAKKGNSARISGSEGEGDDCDAEDILDVVEDIADMAEEAAYLAHEALSEPHPEEQTREAEHYSEPTPEPERSYSSPSSSESSCSSSDSSYDSGSSDCGGGDD